MQWAKNKDLSTQLVDLSDEFDKLTICLQKLISQSEDMENRLKRIEDDKKGGIELSKVAHATGAKDKGGVKLSSNFPKETSIHSKRRL